MGYFISGFVLLDCPQWQALESLPSEVGLRGYKDRRSDLWLLDFWQTNQGKKNTIFTGGHEFSSLTKLPTDDTIQVFDRLAEFLKSAGEEVYGSCWLRLSSAVSKILSQPTFFFAADDEFFDMACHSHPDGMSRISIKIGNYDIRFDRPIWTITPRQNLEDIDEFPEQWSEDVLEQLRGWPNFAVTAPRDVEGGDLFCENALAEWPTDISAPEEVLGIGSFNLLEGFEENFDMVYERPGTV